MKPKKQRLAKLNGRTLESILEPDAQLERLFARIRHAMRRRYWLHVSRN